MYVTVDNVIYKCIMCVLVFKLIYIAFSNCCHTDIFLL